MAIKGKGKTITKLFGGVSDEIASLSKKVDNISPTAKSKLGTVAKTGLVALGGGLVASGITKTLAAVPETTDPVNSKTIKQEDGGDDGSWNWADWVNSLTGGSGYTGTDGLSGEVDGATTGKNYLPLILIVGGVVVVLILLFTRKKKGRK